MDKGISDERRQNIIIRGLFDHWQILVLLAGFIVACFKFYFTIVDVVTKQEKWQTASEQRQDKSRDETETIRIRLAIIEDDVQWLKRQIK